MTTVIVTVQSMKDKETLLQWLNEFCTGKTSVSNCISESGYMYMRTFEIECALESDATLLALRWR